MFWKRVLLWVSVKIGDNDTHLCFCEATVREILMWTSSAVSCLKRSVLEDD